jgi:hypothetical protein
VDNSIKKMDDWVNLPEGVATLSLWNTLHDGDLLEIESDLLARTVTLKFDVAYVRTFHKLPEQTEFVLMITGVESVRLLGSVKWPGEFCVPMGVSRDEESKLVADYQAKWREESRSWSDFEAMTSCGVELLDATLARGANTVALQMGVFTSGRESYLEVFIRGRAIDFSVGDKPVTPEEFVALGETYWTAFANRALTPSPVS